MQYFTEQGETHSDAVQKVRSKFGSRAQILTHRNIRIGGIFGFFGKDGIEISGYVSNEEPRGASRISLEEKNRIIAAAAAAQSSEEAKKSAGGNDKAKETLSQVLSELKELKDKVSPSEAAKHETVHRIEELLEQNDFTSRFIRDILQRMRKELSLSDLEDFQGVQQKVLEWIGEAIDIHRDPPEKTSRCLVLIGPTGVGKTTTVAKLAAMFGLDYRGSKAMELRMLTIDNYRIGAQGQLQTYGEIMKIPVASVDNREEMRKKIALFSDAEMILVDTIGRNPRDYQNIADMRELLDACGPKSEFFLTLCATTKASDVRDILREFEPFKYQAIILTKLDETFGVGNIISVLWEERKALAFITDGQGVPQDIERASPSRLLRNLKGFEINRRHLDELYPGQVD